MAKLKTNSRQIKKKQRTTLSLQAPLTLAPTSIPSCESAKSASHYMQAISHIQNRLIKGRNNINTLMTFITEQTQQSLHAQGVAIELLTGEELICRTASGKLINTIGLRYVCQKNPAQWCLQHNTDFTSANNETDRRLKAFLMPKMPAHALAYTPIYHEQVMIGVLHTITRVEHVFTEDELQFLKTMAGFVSLSLQQQQFEELREKTARQFVAP